MKRIIPFVVCYCLCATAFSQTDTASRRLSDPEAKQVLSAVKIDSLEMLGRVARIACKCIDSVRIAEPDSKKRIAAVAGCIESNTTAYILSIRVMASLMGGANEISIPARESKEFRSYYYDLERYLHDSCAAMRTAIATNDDENTHSMSKIPEALDAYSKGLTPLKNNDYVKAIPFFEDAVRIDPKFAFAWDNLGICYRRTEQYTKAENAYKMSLALDPNGQAPLLNLPVVYVLQEKFDEAIEAYNNILTHHPGDPEAYYGIGLVYFNNKKDNEKALHSMCRAYNIYIEIKSPYRSDAEKVINYIYVAMKKEGKEKEFFQILKDNGISPK